MSNNLDHLPVAIPDQKNYEMAYGLAYKLAVEKLLASDIAGLCRFSESVLITENGKQIVQLSYLNSLFRIMMPEVVFNRVGDPCPVELRDKILILHYLLTASGRPLSGKLISFKELGEGQVYFPTFAQRAIQPLITHFGNNLEKILESSSLLGGAKSDFGDCAVSIPAFIRVPLTLVLWRGDNEFPPNANILFDRCVLDYLPLEDLIVLCQTVVWKMVNSLNSC
jgi:hypothetical protein